MRFFGGISLHDLEGMPPHMVAAGYQAMLGERDAEVTKGRYGK